MIAGRELWGDGLLLEQSQKQITTEVTEDTEVLLLCGFATQQS